MPDCNVAQLDIVIPNSRYKEKSISDFKQITFTGTFYRKTRIFIWHGTSDGRFRAVKDFSIVLPLAPVGRATQELKQRCSGCMVTAATLLMLPSGSWLR